MKQLLFALVLVLAVGCKKKEGESKPAEPNPAEAKPVEAKPVEAKPAEAKPEESKPALAPTGIAECDAIIETYKKFQGCANIKEEDKVVQEVNVGQLKDIAGMVTAAKPEEKDIAQKAAVTQCKATDDTLNKLIAAAGC